MRSWLPEPLFLGGSSVGFQFVFVNIVRKKNQMFLFFCLHFEKILLGFEHKAEIVPVFFSYHYYITASL